MHFKAAAKGKATPKSCPDTLFLPFDFSKSTGDTTQLTGFSPVPVHGRACFATLEDGRTWCIKGVGWSFGPPYFLQSPKDAQLYFGLFDKRDAERELKVSDWVAEQNIRTARVAGYVEFTHELVTQIFGNKPVTFKDGTALIPVQQYTHTLAPYRVADLAYFSDAKRAKVLAETATLCGWPNDPDGFIREFSAQLIETVLKYHSLGCVNDSLSWDNATIAAEPIDFEWFSVPGILLPDGTEPSVMLEPRQQKEILYIGEIIIQLAALLGTQIAMIDILNNIRKQISTNYPLRMVHYKSLFDSVDYSVRCLSR